MKCIYYANMNKKFIFNINIKYSNTKNYTTKYRTRIKCRGT